MVFCCHGGIGLSSAGLAIVGGAVFGSGGGTGECVAFPLKRRICFKILK